MLRRRLLALAATLGGALLAGGSQAAVPPRSISDGISQLNRLRAGVGLPPLEEHPAMSEACRKHVVYMERNDVVTHDEVRGKPGYTKEGAEAGRRSILIGGGPVEPWRSEGSNPWLDAPYHLAHQFSPFATSAGYYQSRLGSACMWLKNEYRFDGVDRIYTYPGAHSRQIPVAVDTTRERPSDPTTDAQLRPPTGIQIVVRIGGSWALARTPMRVAGASLRVGGASKRLALRWRDPSTPRHGSAWQSAILIPVKPLRAGTRYDASVTVQSNGKRLTRDWYFTTAGGRGGPPQPPYDPEHSRLRLLRISPDHVASQHPERAEITYTLGPGGKLTFEIEWAYAKGWKAPDAKIGCYPEEKKHLAGPNPVRCTIYATVLSFDEKVNVAATTRRVTLLDFLEGNPLGLPGKGSTPRALEPGSYRLTLRAAQNELKAGFVVR